MAGIESYLGSGFAYPFELENGAAKIIKGRELVASDLFNLLSTNIGENFFLPERGCRLQELTFEPNDEILRSLARRFIFEAIDAWEKRIKFVGIELEFPDDTAENSNKVLITVSFKILASNEIDSFIFPFYRDIKF